MIEIPDLGDGHHAMWTELFLLDEKHPARWTLIGAHMVALHGWSQGRSQIRASRDVDLLVDVRAVIDGSSRLSDYLLEAGYIFSNPSPEGVGHVFTKGRVRIDVLVPDGIGPRASRRTVGSAHTVMVPGGTQALQRTQHVEVRSRSTAGNVPIPDLLGAILIKARAISVDDQPAAQIRDLAFLLSLVTEPDPLARLISPAERRWLRRHRELADPNDVSWLGIDRAEDGVIVFRRLTQQQLPPKNSASD